MRIHAETFLGDVEAMPDSPEAGVAHRTAGLTHWFAGEYREAREHLERALELFQPGRDDDLAFRFGQDPGVAAMLSLALTLWPLGDTGRAISHFGDAEARITSIAHIATRAHGRLHAAVFAVMGGDLSHAALNAVELARLTREHDLPMYRASGVFLEGLTTAQSGTVSGGLEDMRRGVELRREQNMLLFDGLVKIALAEAEARAGDIDRAVAVLDEALTTVKRTGYRAFEAELHRARGEMLLKRDLSSQGSAEEALQTAIAVAKQQGTRSFRLRAALALAKHYQSTSRPTKAHAVLVRALEGFSPTPEMPEIADAQALLAALVETDEVKAAIAQRERRLHLQIAYGNAVMWSKGFTAEETKDAFARARELAGETENPAERFATYSSQWVRSLARGEHRQAQRTAENFLRQAEEGGYVTEAGFARRCLGASCYYQGKLSEARKHLERTLADYRPDRDAEARFRFGHDAAIVATANLVTTTWQLGQVERARQLAEQAVRRATELGHVPTSAFAHAFKTSLEIVRDDPAAALRSAEALLALVCEHGMEFFVALGEAYAGWARGRLDDPEAGAQAIRRALAEHFNEANRLNAPWLRGLLAELEASARGPDAALTQIGEGLTTAEETGEHYTDSYLHRLRGEFLFKRDPANPVAAEEAFQTAVAIAKEQGARSYGLLASLALAKLYRSTSRPAKAHAVLAPALEGFSPTSEMPEIAEAQALLAALDGNGETKTTPCSALREPAPAGEGKAPASDPSPE
jgi:predicted ATPase